MSPFLDFAICALREGGLDISKDQITEAFFARIWSFVGLAVPGHLGFEVYTISNDRGYQLTIALGPAHGQNVHTATVGQINIELARSRARSDKARVQVFRRSDGGGWHAQATGTLALPVGHPLSELAHNDRHFGVSAERFPRELDDRTAELGLMHLAHVFQRATT